MMKSIYYILNYYIFYYKKNTLLISINFILIKYQYSLQVMAGTIDKLIERATDDSEKGN